MEGAKVKYNFLGKCGVKVFNMALGTGMFGINESWPYHGPRQQPEDVCHQIMDTYASYGGNLIDTSNMYSLGKAESAVGSWLAKHDRNRFVLATKVRHPTDATNVNSLGLSRRHLVEALEASLERLQTHYIDIYQTHYWDLATPIEETLRTFDDLIRCGKVRYLGVNCLCGWQMQKVVCDLHDMGLNACVSLQQQYSLLARQSEFEEFTVCHNEGIAVLSWSPLKGGLLSGKYKRGDTLDETTTRVGFATAKKLQSRAFPTWPEYKDNEAYWNIMDALADIAPAHGKSVAQVALRWLLQKEVVTSVVMGVTSVAQLIENMGAATGWKLSCDEMKRLDDVSSCMRQDFYPHPYIWKRNTDRLNPYTRAYDPVPMC